MGRISSSSLIPVYTIKPPIVHVCTKFQPSRPQFQPSRPHSSWEKYDENFQCLKIGEKEKWRNQGKNKSSSLIPVNTIHPPIVHVYTKFQYSRPHSSWEKCDEIFSFERLRNDEMTESRNDRITEWRMERANPVAPTFSKRGYNYALVRRNIMIYTEN